MKKIIALILAITMMATLAACGSKSDEETKGGTEAATEAAGAEATNAVSEEDAPVKGTGTKLIIYSNSVSDGRGDWLKERAAQDGFDIEYVGAGGGEIYDRLVAEAASPIADITFGLNAIQWENLKAKNILTKYTPAWADEIPAGLNDPDGYYHAIVKQAILLVYDSNQVAPEDVPADWLDLFTKEEFFGKYEYAADLGGGTTRNVLTGILTRYIDPNGDLGISDEGWEAIKQYYQHGAPSEEGVDLYAHMADETNPVVMGQIWSSGIATRDEQYGTKSAYVVPEVGVPYAVEAVAIVNGTKNMEEAQRFVDWFGTAQIQGEWAQKFSTLPANMNAVGMANEFNQEIAKIPAQDIDWALVAENIDQWCEKITLEYIP